MNIKGESTLKICERKLNYLNYSQQTIKNYLSHINRFLTLQSKPCLHLSASDFQNYLDSYTFSSISQQNQIINAIKFLYINVLNKKYNKVSFKRPRKEKTLPKVISKGEILQSISSINNLKHKTIISLAFSSGLRVSEVCNLKITDIDSKRMLISVISGKGRKDRLVPLSQGILELLRKYYLQYKPREYLFENPYKGGKYSVGSCQSIWRKYKINQSSTFHTLRHSCFTNLLENGTDIRVIQKIAGHSNLKTTEGYCHVSTNILNKVQMPI